MSDQLLALRISDFLLLLQDTMQVVLHILNRLKVVLDSHHEVTLLERD